MFITNAINTENAINTRLKYVYDLKDFNQH